MERNGIENELQSENDAAPMAINKSKQQHEPDVEDGEIDEDVAVKRKNSDALESPSKLAKTDSKLDKSSAAVEVNHPNGKNEDHSFSKSDPSSRNLDKDTRHSRDDSRERKGGSDRDRHRGRDRSKERDRDRDRSRDRSRDRDRYKERDRDRARERDRDRERSKHRDSRRDDRDSRSSRDSRDFRSHSKERGGSDHRRTEQRTDSDRSRDRRPSSDQGSKQRESESRATLPDSAKRHESDEEEVADDVSMMTEEDEERIIQERRAKRLAMLQRLGSASNVGSPASEPVSTPPAQPAATPAKPAIKPSALAIAAAEMKHDTPSPASEAPSLAHVPEVSAADYDDKTDKLEESKRHVPVVAKDVHWDEEGDSDTEEVQAKPTRATADEKDEEELDLSLKDTGAWFGTSAPQAEEKPMKAAVPAPKPVDDIFAPVGAFQDDMFAPAGAGGVLPVGKQLTTVKDTNPTLTDNWDDEQGYYRIRVGEFIDNRYLVTTELGSGVFSTVVRAVDKKEGNREIAIKIIRNNETMFKAGQKELAILKKLNAADPTDKRHCVRLLRHFEHRQHLCLVFESLGMNLREIIRKFGKDVGLNIKAVRVYAHHMFQALSLLKQVGVIHADIKPDNILVNQANTHVKLCDFGSACFSHENEITPYLVSRFYRAPEIILGLPYDHAIDTWSVATTLYELYTGKIMFPGRTNNQMLRLMQEVKGKFSHKMIRKGQFSSNHFDEHFRFISYEEDKLTQKTVVRHIAYTNQGTRDLKSMLLTNLSGMSEEDVLQLKRFVDLLDQCLSTNPLTRLSPEEALRHPFIRGK